MNFSNRMYWYTKSKFRLVVEIAFFLSWAFFCLDHFPSEKMLIKRLAFIFMPIFLTGIVCALVKVIYEKNLFSRTDWKHDLHSLELYYKAIKIMAVEALWQQKNKKIMSIGQHTSFPAHYLEKCVYGMRAEGKETWLFGTLDKRLSFFPSMTGTMLNLQSMLGFINGAIVAKPNEPAQAIEGTLCDIFVMAVYLEKCFFYLCKKEKILKKYSYDSGTRNKKLRAAMRQASLLMGVEILDAKEKPLRYTLDRKTLDMCTMKDFVWIGYTDKLGFKTVNHYPLPADIADLYLKDFLSGKVNKPENDLIALARELSNGDMSIYSVAVTRERHLVGTSCGSAHFRFLEKLVKEGLVERVSVEAGVPGEIAGKLATFSINEENRLKILAVLKQARPDIYPVSNMGTGLQDRQ